MAIDFTTVLKTELRDQRVGWDERGAILYALATGFGREDLAEEQAFVREGPGFLPVPTFATTLARADFPAECGWDYSRVLHVSQALEIHSPLLPADKVVIDSAVIDAYDRGEDRGCVIVTQSEARRTRDKRALFSSTATWLARGDSGVGDTIGQEGFVEVHNLPQRDPDFFDHIEIRSDQALLYRLCGDLNPLHADRAAARKAGFERPILHGLCTLGTACRAVLKTVCEYDPTLISGCTVRFTAPVYPGDTLAIEMWQDGSVISFRATAGERDEIVMDHGRFTLT